MFWIRHARRAAAVAALLVLAALCAASASADPAGRTTLTQTIQIAPGTGFRQLQAGPGEPFVTRQGPLGRAGKERAGKRQSLLYFGQVSDVHIRDEMSPARVELTDPVGSPLDAAFRPQEALSTQVFAEMLRNFNLNRSSPVKQGNGKRDSMRFVISTGDDTDNQQFNESSWFVKVLNGGAIDPFSGKTIGPGNPCAGQSQQTIDKLNADVAARQYTGVQDYNDYSPPTDRYAGFWDPDQAPPGGPYAAFPRYPGLMNRAQAPFTSEGLKVPWFDVRGNHDGLVQGNIAATLPAARALITNCIKPFPGASFDPATLRGLTESQVIAKFSDPAFQQALLGGTVPVPPDPDRRFVDSSQFRALRNGHGYQHVDKKELKASDGAASYYAWSPRKDIRFISLDTVAEGGGQNGNLDDPQYKWLARELRKDSNTEYKGNKLVGTHHSGKLVFLFSHHSLRALSNTNADEKAGKCTGPTDVGCDRDPRKSTPLHLGLTGKQNVRDLVERFPNVVAWIDGHAHTNKITPYVRSRGKTGLWDINTASHVDFPEQSRLIDLMDNRDGTLSLFTTMMDDAAPIQAPAPGAAGSFDVAQLASLARLLGANDPQGKGPGVGTSSSGTGTRKDRNTELLIRDPRRLRGG